MHRLIRLFSRAEALAFHRDLPRAAKTQEQILLRILKKNQGTLFGRRHQFAKLASIRDYQNYLPLQDYDSLLEDLRRQRESGQQSLVAEDILLYECSSGSSAASKYLPYTASLKKEFLRGIQPWLHDLYRSFAGVRKGSHYWSVSPLLREKQYTPQGIPIGFEEDSAYFGRLQARLLEGVFCAPSSLKLLRDMEEFRFQTLYHLLKCRDLSLISIWNPSFLSLLLESLQDFWPDLMHQLKKRHPARFRELQGMKGERPSAFWPKLSLISAWDQAGAKEEADALKKLFPDVPFQGKGLLATEGIISFPLEEIGKILAYRSHFFEFLHGPSGKLVCMQEVEKNQHYSVILTTGAGLYRYRLYDEVRVEGFYQGVPLLSFVGKEAFICDVAGEKLHEAHVQKALQEAGVKGFCFVAPLQRGYALFAEAGVVNRAMVRRLEEKLRDNFHYDYARRLGQLESIRYFEIEGDARKQYYEIRSRNMRLGDIKFSVLYREKGLEKLLRGQFRDLL